MAVDQAAIPTLLSRSLHESCKDVAAILETKGLIHGLGLNEAEALAHRLCARLCSARTNGSCRPDRTRVVVFARLKPSRRR